MYQPKIGYTTVTWAEGRQEGWLERGVRDIAVLGFPTLETFATAVREYDTTPGRFRGLLEENGVHLVCLDVWADYQDPGRRAAIVEDHLEVAQTLKDLGGEILMTVPTKPGDGPRWGSDDFKVAAETLNEVGKRCLDLGIKNALHPHWGTYVETGEEIERILDATDPRYVFFAPDSGQIAKGETDPVALLRAYIGRVAHVHLKDVAANWPELRKMGVSLAMPEGYAPLGEGICDIRGFIAVLAQANYQGWMMGELDKAEDPKASALVSKRFLTDEMGFSI